MTHIVTVVLSPKLILHNVLFVPHFSFNLISVSKLASSYPYSVNFQQKFCIIPDPHSDMMIESAKRIQNLYQLVDPTYSVQISDSPFFPSSCLLYANKASNDDVWHYRLGHLSNSRLKCLQQIEPNIVLPSFDCCYVCHLAKQKKIPFSLRQSLCQSL